MAEPLRHFLLCGIHMSQHYIHPGMGTVQDHNLIAGIKNNVPATGSHRRILPPGAQLNGAGLFMSASDQSCPASET